MTYPTPFSSRDALTNVATETVLLSAVAVGDLIYVPGSTAVDPYRVRALDRFPDGTVNVFGTPGTLMQRASFEPLGHYDADVQTIKRVMI